MKRLLVGLMLAAVLASACSAPGSAVVVEVTATPTQPAPTETPPPTEVPPAAQAALEALAAALGIPVSQIKLVSVEAVEWPDSCLGVVRIDALCAQGIVPGFRIILEADGQQYEYHTNQDGSALTPAGAPAPTTRDGIVEAARRALAKALGLALEDISVVRSMAVEWPDSCLGLSLPGMACAEAITPGYLIELQAGGRVYAYHSNQTGSALMPGSLVLTWERNGGIAGFCDSLVVFASGEVQAASCRGDAGRREGVLTAEERAQLDEWLTGYGSVVVLDTITPMPADGMEVKLTLSGLGSGQPTQADEQALVAWAQAVFTRLAQ